MKQITQVLFLIVVAFSINSLAQQAILNGSIAVNTSTLTWIRFYAPETSNHIVGRFKSEGSINAYIVDDDGLTNLRGGSNFLQYYDSGNVVVANIDIRLSRGTYYLVFKNNNILSAKTVGGNVSIVSEGRENPQNSMADDSEDDPFRCTVKRGGANLILESGKVRFLSAGAKLQLLEVKAKYSKVSTISYRGRILSKRITCD
ncbi:MAG: hypothetical protein ACKVQW_08750 [Pyrinomonadaceae bacterium]